MLGLDILQIIGYLIGGKAYYKDYNSNNIEIWSFTLEDIPQDTKVQFCISYTVNGEIYWDNNFGDNYEG